MKAKTPELSDLLFERMDVRADYGRSIADKAKVRGGLTRMEVCEMELLSIDQDKDKRDWAAVLRSEGHYVNTLDGPTGSLRTGIRVDARGSGRPKVHLYGDIGVQFGGMIADDLRLALSEVLDSVPLELHVHSDGGDFGEGVAMHSLISSRSGPTYGYVDGRACSAATFPLMACLEVTMPVGSRMMIHQASASLSGGEADDFAIAAKQLAETNRSIVAIYAPRWRGSMESLSAAVAAETWFTAEQAVAAGLADTISQDKAIAASVSRRHQFKNIPAPLTIAARLEDCPNLLASELALHRCAIVR